MFAHRSGSHASSPSAGGGAAAPLSVEALRRRARQRLIGAAILVLAAVIGLPWLLESQPRPVPVDIAIEIPSRHAAPPLPPPAPRFEAAPPPAAAEAPPPAPVASAPPAERVERPAPVADHAPASPPAAPSPAAATPARPQADAAAKVRIVVQVGAFADPARAQEVRQRLERAGLKTYIHVAETPEGKRIRVRVGPFDSRAEAEKVAEKVKGLGLPAAVLTL
ncbi:SPOR domain-containing protein [Tepidimonas sp.]|uniref:SPOR domain-containing protein n=1 Tax=Tepidimonas sp. TaxID=2002775 RepID=UPI0028CFCDF1|nr:SPOR domain-containing protein [Tepidimonas sp.]MDT7929470.1 SPOR domain-containing protein [Tepidimonas sp.]